MKYKGNFCVFVMLGVSVGINRVGSWELGVRIFRNIIIKGVFELNIS